MFTQTLINFAKLNTQTEEVNSEQLRRQINKIQH